MPIKKTETTKTKAAPKKKPEKAVKKAALTPTVRKSQVVVAGPVSKTQAFIMEVYSRNPVGRPRFYTTADELEDVIGEYFAYCQENKNKLTIMGLILFCGFSDRASFYDYEQKQEFTHVIKKARAIITMHYEEKLQEAFPQGAVFALKNMGWSAEEKVETTVKTATSFYISGEEDEFTEHEEVE